MNSIKVFTAFRHVYRCLHVTHKSRHALELFPDIRKISLLISDCAKRKFYMAYFLLLPHFLYQLKLANKATYFSRFECYFVLTTNTIVYLVNHQTNICRHGLRNRHEYKKWHGYLSVDFFMHNAPTLAGTLPTAPAGRASGIGNYRLWNNKKMSYDS